MASCVRRSIPARRSGYSWDQAWMPRGLMSGSGERIARPLRNGWKHFKENPATIRRAQGVGAVPMAIDRLSQLRPQRLLGHEDQTVLFCRFVDFTQQGFVVRGIERRLGAQ